MKLDGVENTKRGIWYGTINRGIGLILPFFIQTIMIRQLGIQYIGIKGLFTSILTVFSLAELGFGNAVVYAMYRPIAMDDNETLCALLNLYRNVYRIIGLVIALLGCGILPFLSLFVKDSYPNEISIEIVFGLYLLNTILSYWLYAYKSSLLYAYQRMDVVSIANTITRIVMFIGQVLVLVLAKNFYLFLIVSIGSTILNNVMIKFITERLFPNISCRGDVPEVLRDDIRKKVRGLLIGRLCDTTRNSFDSIFIAAFVGLTQTAIYSNYYYIITALNGLTWVVLSSLIGGVGNKLILEDREKNYEDMMLLNNIYMVIAGIMTAMMLCLYQPFMSVWMGVDNLFTSNIMIMFPIYFYIGKMGDIRSVYSDAAGLFWENRWRCIMETVANIILNYTLGKHWGVVGILIATIITLFLFGFIASAIVIFRCYFTNGKMRYFKNHLYIGMGTFIVCVISYMLCACISFKNIWGVLLLRCMTTIGICIIVYWLFFHKTVAYDSSKRFILVVFKGKGKTCDCTNNSFEK